MLAESREGSATPYREPRVRLGGEGKGGGGGFGLCSFLTVFVAFGADCTNPRFRRQNVLELELGHYGSGRKVEWIIPPGLQESFFCACVLHL